MPTWICTGCGVEHPDSATEPAIGHRSFVVQTADGNLLWDAPGYLDDEIIGLVGRRARVCECL